MSSSARPYAHSIYALRNYSSSFPSAGFRPASHAIGRVWGLAAALGIGVAATLGSAGVACADDTTSASTASGGATASTSHSTGTTVAGRNPARRPSAVAPVKPGDSAVEVPAAADPNTSAPSAAPTTDPASAIQRSRTSKAAAATAVSPTTKSTATKAAAVPTARPQPAVTAPGVNPLSLTTQFTTAAVDAVSAFVSPVLTAAAVTVPKPAAAAVQPAVAPQLTAASTAKATAPINPLNFISSVIGWIGREIANLIDSFNYAVASIQANAAAWWNRKKFLPTVSVADTSLTEGNAGTANMAFTVSLSKASANPVTVNYTTADGTATAGSDYVAGSGSVSFAAGETSKTVNVGVIGDTTVEPDETFTVTLSNPFGATLSRATATGTILNDDVPVATPPAMSISDASKTEGNTGTSNLAFTVSLSQTPTAPVSVNYSTANGTATAGSDYVAGSGTLNFAAGETSKAINVGIIGDTTVEPDENFTVTLSNPTGATLSRATATGTILNDDVVVVTPPTVSIGNASKTEGNSGTANMSFTATLSKAATVPVTVDYATSNGTATAGSDYVAGSGTVTFAAGQTSQTVNVGIIGDTVVEPDETFNVTLSNPTGATIAQAVATGTILNDDTAVTTPPLFSGDYSTGNFSQWQIVQTRSYNGPGTSYVPSYSASLVNDAVKGTVARFEVRTGDVPSFGGGERAEVQSSTTQTSAGEGSTMWYGFSTKFDPSFPQNHADLGWELTNQWHSDADGSPPISWSTSDRNGYYSLRVDPQSSPGVYLGSYSILDTPLNVGNWINVKMEVHWSTTSSGWVKVWINGVQQTFKNGSTTYYVQTMTPGTTAVYYKEGIYREAGTSSTDVVYHSGYRSATTEAGLG